MSQWKAVANSSSPPKWRTVVAKKAANGQVLYTNSTPGSFINNQVVGVYAANNGASIAHSGFAHGGWQIERFGTGPVTSLTVTAGGTGYNNTDVITVSGGQVNATANPVTNSTGGIGSVTVVTAGRGFSNVASATVAVANSTGGSTSGSAATLVPVLGGRAGRKMHETLVTLKNMT